MQPGEDLQRPLDKKAVLFAIGSGGLSAVLAISLATGSSLAVLLAYLAPFPLFLAGLGNGAKSATIAGFAGLVVSSLAGGPLLGLVFFAFVALPSWLAIRLALASRINEGRVELFPVGGIILTFSAYASGVFVLGLLFMATSELSVAKMVEDFLLSVVETVGAELTADQKDLIIGQLAPFFPAMIICSWMFMIVINAVLAQAALTKSGKALRPSPKYSEISLPDVASWAFIVCAILTVISSGDAAYVARNITVVMAVPFFAVGISLVHQLVKLTSFAGALLGAYYVLLLLSVWVILPTIGLGLIEQWFGLRDKIRAKAQNQEND